MRSDSCATSFAELGGQERMALHLHRVVGHERGAEHAALPRVMAPEAHESSTATRTSAGMPLDAGAARCRSASPAQQQAFLVGVAGVVEDQLRPADRRGAEPATLWRICSSALRNWARSVSAARTRVARVHATQLDQHLRHGLRVGGGVAQAHPPRCRRRSRRRGGEAADARSSARSAAGTSSPRQQPAAATLTITFTVRGTVFIGVTFFSNRDSWESSAGSASAAVEAAAGVFASVWAAAITTVGRERLRRSDQEEPLEARRFVELVRAGQAHRARGRQPARRCPPPPADAA